LQPSVIAGGGETMVIGDARGTTDAVHFELLLTNRALSPRRQFKLEPCSDENEASFEDSDSRDTTATVGTFSSKAPVAMTPQILRNSLPVRVEISQCMNLWFQLWKLRTRSQKNDSPARKKKKP